jgi:hypothetical protein
MAASFFAATVLVAGDRAHRPIVTSKQQVSGYTGIKDSWQALRLFQRRLDRLDKPFVFAISRGFHASARDARGKCERVDTDARRRMDWCFAHT